jgi:hypothetical protein
MRRRCAILFVTFALGASACESLVILGGVSDAAVDESGDDARANDVSNDVGDAFFSDVNDGSTVVDAGPCFTNSDCVPGTEFCFTNGGCGTAGECQLRPTGCTDASMFDAAFDGATDFCDCAGITVPNICTAYAQGENVKHAGGCP